MTWMDSTFWQTFEDAGMLVEASVLYAGGSTPVTAQVGYEKPDVQDFAGTQSKQYVMEYQHVDLPYLAEGDQVIIADSTFIVREPPVDLEEGGANGTFRKALLTRTGPTC